MFHGTPFELSPSHFNCATRPEDPKPLAASGDLGLVLSTRLFFYPLILAGWAFLFLPFVSWALRPVPSWILGLKSFGLTILFPCSELNLFIITFHEVGPLYYFFRPWCYDFLDLNKDKDQIRNFPIYIYILFILWVYMKFCLYGVCSAKMGFCPFCSKDVAKCPCSETI